MSKTEEVTDWREARRHSARAAIVDAAWALVRQDGLAALSLRDLARRAGITTPTVYAYFDSKAAIYDAMFGQAAGQFELEMSSPYDTDDPREVLIASLRRFVGFCTERPPPLPAALPAHDPRVRTVSGLLCASRVRALTRARERLATNGITDPRHLDMWTALTIGLVDQQISNDPGGDRWIRLIDDYVSMFLAHCLQQRLHWPTARE